MICLKRRTSIIDVVVDYNFSSQSAFCRIFKTVYGVTWQPTGVSTNLFINHEPHKILHFYVQRVKKFSCPFLMIDCYIM
jgi:AraC-like DNA-binding protein